MWEGSIKIYCKRGDPDKRSGQAATVAWSAIIGLVNRKHFQNDNS